MDSTDSDGSRPLFGFSRFDGRALHTERDRDAESIRTTLYTAGLRDFDVVATDDGFSIAATSDETRATLDDPARFASVMASAGYTTTRDRDDDQAVLAWPTDDAVLDASAFADWGGWRLDPANATLEHPESEYWVDLTDCTTSAEVLDSIAQVVYKRWSDDRALAGLVRAVDDILHLQATLCPDGSARSLTAEEIKTRIADVARTAPKSYLVQSRATLPLPRPTYEQTCRRGSVGRLLVYVDRVCLRNIEPRRSPTNHLEHEPIGQCRKEPSSGIASLRRDLPEPAHTRRGLSKHSVGFVYVLSNDAMPGLVKVGMTTKLAEDRAGKLRGTGVPLPFKVEFRAATSMPKAVEAASHRLLNSLRLSPDREFFEASPSHAIEAVKTALRDAAGLDAWFRHAEVVFIRHQDRIALTLEADDFFVVLTYPTLLSDRPDPTDNWQVHADGDLLELMGTDNPGHVAGFSDNDEGGTDDPTPYLDRSSSTPNGAPYGLERLVAGQRLLWLRPLADATKCKIVIFEVVDYCQLVARSWNLAPRDHPILLNAPTAETLPVGVILATRLAMRLKRPRSWAPRNPDPLDGWAPTKRRAQPPDYWLQQLKHP